MPIFVLVVKEVLLAFFGFPILKKLTKTNYLPTTHHERLVFRCKIKFNQKNVQTKFLVEV